MLHEHVDLIKNLATSIRVPFTHTVQHHFCLHPLQGLWPHCDNLPRSDVQIIYYNNFSTSYCLDQTFTSTSQL